MKLDEITCYTDRGISYVNCVCSKHQLEHCNSCCYAFEEMNIYARENAINEEKFLCHRDGCKNKGALICSSCKQARYCGKECQRQCWKQHKIKCNNDKKLRINISAGDLKDEFVEVYPTNTRLSQETSRHEEKLKLKIISFNLGKGPYEDPEVKYDPRKYKGYSDEDLCSYTVQYSNSQEITNVPCVELHEDGWTIESNNNK